MEEVSRFVPMLSMNTIFVAGIAFFLLGERLSIQAYAGKSEEVLLCDFQPQASTYAACTADNLH